MRKDDPTTYPKWLRRKIGQLEDEKKSCCRKGEELKGRLDSLKSVHEILDKAGWSKTLTQIPGGIRISLDIIWRE